MRLAAAEFRVDETAEPVFDWFDADDDEEPVEDMNVEFADGGGAFNAFVDVDGGGGALSLAFLDDADPLRLRLYMIELFFTLLSYEVFKFGNQILML